MTVTRLYPKNNKKTVVCIDEEIAFVLYKGDFNKYHIFEGREMPEDEYDEIMNELLPRRAAERSYKLLMSRDYTEKQLRDKLEADEYPESVIEDTVRRLKEQKYIDDMRYAENYIFWQAKRKSKLRLIMDLKQKGIREENILDVYDKLLERKDIDKEEESIRQFLIKKNVFPDELSTEERRKITMTLLRKGYSYDSVKHVLNNSLDDF